MDIDENLVEEIFVELSSTICSRAMKYAQDSRTFRGFTDDYKHLIDVTDELSNEMDNKERFYSTMNRAHKYFLGNNY